VGCREWFMPATERDVVGDVVYLGAPAAGVAGRRDGDAGEGEAAEVVEGFQRAGESGAGGEAGGLQPGEIRRTR
jgi:hypothetical protein